MQNPMNFRQLLGTASDIAEPYYLGLRDRSIMPQTTAAEVRERLRQPLPTRGMDVGSTFDVIRDHLFPMSRHNGHPGFFGCVASPGTEIAAIGEFLAAVLNANVTSWRSAPAATEMEHVVIDWLKEMVGYHPEAGGLLVSGGSMANLCGLAAALASVAPEAEGGGLRGTLRIYASEEAHFSVSKAARLLGIGANNVVGVRTDELLRMDTRDLDACMRRDRDAGLTQVCIVASAGTVSTGTVDPIDRIADMAQEHGVWLHVDGCYGAPAAMARTVLHLFSGLERADSLALDPHKWLYGTVGCGCVLYRDLRHARTAFGHSADYTKPLGLEQDEAFAFWDYGPELSRPFRALPVWMQIRHYGTEGLAEAIERNLDCARYFAALAQAAEDMELLAPVELSIFCFRCKPRGYTGDLDAFNEKVMLEVQRSGTSYLSNARVRGVFALRGCVLNYRTERGHMDQLLEDVRAAAARVMQEFR